MAIEYQEDVDLGLVLLKKRIVTSSQLSQAFEYQKIKGGYLSQHLIDMGFVSDADIATCLTCHFGYCYIPVKSYHVEPAVLSFIPFRNACDYCVLPIEKNDRLLTIVMADPLNKGVIEYLRRLTQSEIVVFISRRGEVIEAIEKGYGLPFHKMDLDAQFREDGVLRENLYHDYVLNSIYNGPNRRRYKRIYVDLPAECHAYPYQAKAKVRDISVRGVFFETTMTVDKGSQVMMNVFLEDAPSISAVIEITRARARSVIQNYYETNNTYTVYEAGGFFNFIDPDSQSQLSNFLKKKINI